ncbi:MAG: enoyl-CoA hydratase-related protein [Ilumatobacteraceae bacterium]
MTGAVRVDRHGDFSTITLSNPAKRNALSLDVLHQLIDTFTTAGQSDARGIILAAEGPVFSAGHNFGDMFQASQADAQQLFTVCSYLMKLMHNIPQPIIAKVHALATAAGCQLVATCDLAVAGRSAGFALPGGKGGLFCHTPLVAVARSLPPKRAMELALTGDVISAEVAEQWGLINSVVDDDKLDEAVLDLLNRATRGSVESKALGKKTYYEQVGMNVSDAYEFASAVMADAAVSDVAQMGIQAFLEKRHPDFGSR